MDFFFNWSMRSGKTTFIIELAIPKLWAKKVFVIKYKEQALNKSDEISSGLINSGIETWQIETRLAVGR